MATANQENKPAQPVAVSEAEMEQDEREIARILSDQPKVKIRLPQKPRGDGEPLPDEFVCINGHAFIIQRGVTVEVPESVAEVLEQAGRI